MRFDELNNLSPTLAETPTQMILSSIERGDDDWRIYKSDLYEEDIDILINKYLTRHSFMYIGEKKTLTVITPDPLEVGQIKTNGKLIKAAFFMNGGVGFFRDIETGEEVKLLFIADGDALRYSYPNYGYIKSGTKVTREATEEQG